MLAEDTRDALEDKLAHHEEVLESYLAQIHQLSFEGDELAGRQLKVRALISRLMRAKLDVCNSCLTCEVLFVVSSRCGAGRCGASAGCR